MTLGFHKRITPFLLLLTPHSEDFRAPYHGVEEELLYSTASKAMPPQQGGVTKMTSEYIERKKVEREIEKEIQKQQQELDRQLRHELWLAKVRAKRQINRIMRKH